MKARQLHSWQISTSEAKQIQTSLARQISHVNEVTRPRFIAGADISVQKTTMPARAAIVSMSYPEFKIIEVQIAEGNLNLPYIPGLLSFREAPLILAACQKLSMVPDLILVDGQGIAHPRRFGIASHLGLLLNTPTIGCAKSRLCGSHETPEDKTGAYEEIRDDGGDIIGAALRTKKGTKPIYVSIGHKIDLPAAIYWTMESCRGYRIPEPTRQAHIAAGSNTQILTKDI
jgi:deoxyribonuclease V